MVALPLDSKMSSIRLFSRWAVAARRYRPSKATSASRSALSSKRLGSESSSRHFSRSTLQRAPARGLVTSAFSLKNRRFRETAGLGYEAGLTDPLEPFSFRDMGGHRGIGGDKTALLSGFISLRGTWRDKERNPVAVRLRSGCPILPSQRCQLV